MTNKKNEIIKQEFKNHIIEIVNKNIKVVLSLGILTIAYFIFSDLFIRHSTASFYARLLPFSLAVSGLILHMISKKNSVIAAKLFNLFLTCVQVMMYWLLLIFIETETLNETITATILTIFLISLILQTNVLNTALIYFLPFTVFISLLLIFFDVSKKELLEIINIIPMLALGFVGNRIHYRLRFKNFETNFLLNEEKKKTEQLYEETLLHNEQLNQGNEEIKAANDKLKELDDFKQGVTNMIVHDLKTPLNAIIGLSKNKTVLYAGKHMLNLVMNILDVYKYEDTEIKLTTGNHSIYEVSKSSLQQVQLLYEIKKIKVINNIQDDIVKIDRDIIERIFVNILTNAIKFTPDTGSITLESTKKSSEFILIKIKDTGQGIPDDELENVFNKFEQVTEKKSGTLKSTGIGLTFCKMFIKAHGGKIGLESEIKKGTTIWFTLPVGEHLKKKILK